MIAKWLHTVKLKLAPSRLKLAPSRIRSLTQGEQVLAYSVFGASLDTSEIRLKTAWWVLPKYAVSPNGNIYFHWGDWIADFSVASLNKQGWLIHELAHVWQLQQGMKVVRGALFNRRYGYVLKEGRSFDTYGIEQQAKIIEDYFLRREQGMRCEAWETCIPFLQVS